MADAPSKRCPDFSLFREHGLPGYPLLDDQVLEPLRAYERIEDERDRLEERKSTVRTFGKGAPVKCTEGAYAGMSGIVKRPGGKFTLVLFPGRAVEVKNFWLHPSA